MSEHAYVDAMDLSVVARSFVVRALLERDPGVGRADSVRRAGVPGWHGFVTDAQTGARQAWRAPGDVARFIEMVLTGEVAAVAGGGTDGRIRGAAMAGPALTDVVTGMLSLLGQHLPAVPAPPPVPVSNVTLEHVRERLVGLGNQAGTEPTGPLGSRTIRGGRLDAGVRFQVWATSPTDADDAVRTLQGALLDDREHLRTLGFLRLVSTGTTLAEHVPAIPAWRKATSFDVLYEYRYADEDAASLIARIPVASDVEATGGPAHEEQTLVDDLVRWDQEAALPLVVRGPAAVRRVAALMFLPGPPLGGTVTFRRTAAGGGAVTAFPDLDSFLAATSGTAPTHTDAEVSLAPADAWGALGPASPGPDLGDWDTDGAADAYTGADRRLVEPLVLHSARDRFEIRYAPPPGPAPGLDQTAVVYLRVNPP